MEKFLRDGVDFQKFTKGNSGDAHFFEDFTSPSKVRQYLDSPKEHEKLKGMKWLLAMLSKGKDVSEFFADVVKNVVAKGVEIKKMVYVYLVHYADYDAACREIALLSINSFQKDMSGVNPLIRGLALRVMTSIRVPDIIQIQLLAVKKCATDNSPYVRKCAATALTKIYSFDPEQLPNLKQILEKLFRDASTMVLGSALSAFNEICPHNFELLHRSYRKLCHLLADLDEWSQITALEVMTRYVRNQFTDPAPGATAAVKLQAKQRSSSAVRGKAIGSTVRKKLVRKAFYSDEEDELDEEEVELDLYDDDAKVDKPVIPASLGSEGEGNLDPDHRLILRSSQSLLKSRNAGVVLAVCALHYYCGSHNTAISQQIGKALVRILRNRREIQFVVLKCINSMANERPAIFREYLSDFFITPTDPVFNKLLKLEILTSLCTKENIHMIIRELQIYIRDSNLEFVAATIRAVGRVADVDTEVSDKCMDGLMQLMAANKANIILEQSTVVLRQLIQQNPSSSTSAKVVRQLAKLLIAENGVEEASARSSIVWLLGEFHSNLGNAAPDVLRILAAGFVEEGTDTRSQIVTMSIKLALAFPDDENVQSLMTYILEMARYDVETDLRDRSRFMTAVMGLAPSAEDGEGAAVGGAVDEEALEELAEHAKGILLASKLPPVTLLGSVDIEGVPNFNLGSLSALVGHYVADYEPVAAWPDVQPNPTVRDTLKLGSGEANADGGDKRWNQASDAPSSAADHSDGDDFYGEKSKHKNRRRSDSASSATESASSRSVSSSNAESESDSEASQSRTESSSEKSDSDSESEETSSDGGSSSDSSKGSASDSEDEVVRIPITQAKPQAQRQAMRRVATTGGSAVKNKSGGTVTTGTNLLSDLAGMSVGSTGASTAARSVSAAFSPAIDDLSDIFPTAPPPPSFEASDLMLADDVFSPMQKQQQPSGAFSNLPGTHIAPFGGIGSLSPSSLGYAAPPSGGATPELSSMFGSMSMQNNMAMNSNFVTTGVPVAGGMPGLNLPPQPPTAQIQMQQNVMSGGPRLAGLVSPRSPTGPQETLSDYKPVLKPELGGGLQVGFLFRHGHQASAFAGAQCAFLVVKNNSDHNIRRIKVTFPSDVRKTSVEDIAALAPSQEVRIPMEIVLSGTSGKSLRVDVRCDAGSYVGAFAPQAADLLMPHTMNSTEFSNLRNRLGGFSEVTRSFDLRELGLPAGDVEVALMQATGRLVNAYLVQGAGVNELMFAACIRKGLSEERALITVSTTSDKVLFRFNCEDAVLSTNLAEHFRRSLNAK